MLLCKVPDSTSGRLRLSGSVGVDAVEEGRADSMRFGMYHSVLLDPHMDSYVQEILNRPISR